MAIPFDITPTTSSSSATFTLANGDKATLSLYTATGAGLLPGAYALIQREVSTGIWETYDTLTHTRDSLDFFGIGNWRLFKPASSVAYGAKGN